MFTKYLPEPLQEILVNYIDVESPEGINDLEQHIKNEMVAGTREKFKLQLAECITKKQLTNDQFRQLTRYHFSNENDLYNFITSDVWYALFTEDPKSFLESQRPNNIS